MQIILYKNQSDPIVVDKTITQTNVLNGNLKDNCSFLNPIILCNLSNPPEDNYAYIPDLARYYFITDYEFINKNLWSLSFKVDVLMSWGKEIKSNTAILSRQEHLFNLDLTDPLLVTSNERFLTTKVLDNGLGSLKDSGYILTVQ